MFVHLMHIHMKVKPESYAVDKITVIVQEYKLCT